MIAGSHGNCGFGYDAARDGYEIDEEAGRVVRRIFRMVGAEGATLHAVKRTFEREGLPTPKGGTFWSQPFLRSVVLDDVYKPYAFEEVGAAKAWLDKLSQADRKRSTFQDMAAEGLLTLEELREKLADLEDTRKVAERELKTVRDRAERVAQLELDKETLLTSFGGEWPAALDTLAPEERQRVYRCSGCGWTRRPTATSS